MIGIAMEEYVDEKLVKSFRDVDQTEDLTNTLERMRHHHVRLNPMKCAFTVQCGKFRWHMVS